MGFGSVCAYRAIYSCKDMVQVGMVGSFGLPVNMALYPGSGIRLVLISITHISLYNITLVNVTTSLHQEKGKILRIQFSRVPFSALYISTFRS